MGAGNQMSPWWEFRTIPLHSARHKAVRDQQYSGGGGLLWESLLVYRWAVAQQMTRVLLWEGLGLAGLSWLLCPEFGAVAFKREYRLPRRAEEMRLCG